MVAVREMRSGRTASRKSTAEMIDEPETAPPDSDCGEHDIE